MGMRHEEAVRRLDTAARHRAIDPKWILVSVMYEDLYCVTIEWDWDDDTQSESTPDCEPYEPGTSTIRRRYSTRHRFDDGGRYQIRISLKKHDDTVASARTTLELRVD